MISEQGKKGRQTISVDLKDAKGPFLAACSAMKVTPSDLIRKVVLDLVGNQPKLEPPGQFEIVSGAAGRGATRVEVRFTDDEYEALSKSAASMGFENVQHLILALSRGYLTLSPQFGKEEMAALGESNRQLLSMGRNLNQIARALNQGGMVSGFTDDRINQLYARIVQHTEYVSRLIAANIERWRLDDGKGR